MTMLGDNIRVTMYLIENNIRIPFYYFFNTKNKESAYIGVDQWYLFQQYASLINKNIY